MFIISNLSRAVRAMFSLFLSDFFVNFNDESIELSFNDVDTCILIPDYKKLFEDKNNAK